MCDFVCYNSHLSIIRYVCADTVKGQPQVLNTRVPTQHHSNTKVELSGTEIRNNGNG